jgi:hypothetical protein
MAKKSKRPPARKQQQRRPQPQRPAFPQRSASPAPVSELPIDAVQDDYAAGALPNTESDGPMPLPPAELDVEDEEEELSVPAAAATRPAATAATGGERRRVGRIDPTAAAVAQQRPGQRARGGRTTATAAMFEPLPPEDAAIPFDRVPYVPGDLRRVLIIAGIMVILIVIADIVVNSLVK